MSELLFPAFLQSEEAFAECVAFWERLFWDLAGDSTDWRVGYDGRRRASAGPPEPIEDRITFEGYSPSLRRLIQVYQGDPPNSDGPDLITLALKEMPLPPASDPHVLALLVSLVLSRSTAAAARDALSVFMDPAVSRETLLATFTDR